MEKFYYAEITNDEGEWEPVDEEYVAFPDTQSLLEFLRDRDYEEMQEIRFKLFEEVPREKVEGARYLYATDWDDDAEDYYGSGLCDSASEAMKASILQVDDEEGGWEGFRGIKQFKATGPEYRTIVPPKGTTAAQP